MSKNGAIPHGKANSRRWLLEKKNKTPTHFPRACLPVHFLLLREEKDYFPVGTMIVVCTRETSTATMSLMWSQSIASRAAGQEFN